ncbi:F-box/kelch-repeat protein At3g23880-like [Vicia villosa]|uniref:F-box/kelch-repeat protein At3g23880-like n=1 Tax=Vicia villosa TaxID=3911 RepID=UPI00273B8C6A|nr:F-box/kelch-repeat protein At3g23880-like [Vicia villosa]
MTMPPVFFPDDLISVVFSVLPVKSLVRFRCLSKSCDSLISDPIFVKFHLKRSSIRNPVLTINTQHIKQIPGDFLCEIQWEVDECVVPCPVSRLIDNPSLTLFIDPCYQWNIDQIWGRIVGVCNGLICLCGESFNFIHSYPEYWLRLCNPATRITSPRFGYFPYINHGDDSYGYSFGCDSSTDTYKVVAFKHIPDPFTTDVRILSLGDNVWRNLESFPVIPLRLGYEEKDVYFSGTLNWLAIHNMQLYNFKDITVEQFVIVSLDLATETYHQYRLPNGFDEVPSKEPTIGVLGDFLCFSYSYRETDFVIWQMKKFGVEDSWTQFLKISYQDLQIDYDFNDVTTKYRFQLMPMLLCEDEDMLILKSGQDLQVILYNLRENRVVRTDISVSRTPTDNRTSDHVAWNFFKGSVESLVPVF